MENKKVAILSMGLPGAGKSYVLNENYNMEDYILIDPDRIKEEKEDYDPKHPEVYHEWSKKEAKMRMAMAVYQGQNLIIDGTGTNVEKMYKQIKELQMQQYKVILLYVKVSLKTSIKRNSERERNVPESIIYEKFETIEYAFDILSGIADEIKVVVNE